MITKKIKQDKFAWEPSAFGGKGYWFVLGKKGGLGRAASKQEAGILGKPKDSEVNPASPKVLETKPAKKPKKQTTQEQNDTSDNGMQEDTGEVDTPKGKMSYGEAARIRRKGLFSTIMEKKFEEGKGFGTSIRESISEKSKATAKGFKEKLDPLNLVKSLTGSGAIGKSIRTVAGRAMGRSDEDIGYFGGYERNKKSKKGGTAELISSGIPKPPGATATEDDSAAAIVMKIYDLLKEQYGKKKTTDELSNMEKGSGKIGGTFVPTKTTKGTPSAEKEKDSGSPIDNILGMFGLGRTALSLLTTLGPLLVNPIVLGLLGAVAAAAIGKWLYEQIKLDPEAALRGEGGIGMAVAGLGSEGQLPSYSSEQSSKAEDKKAQQVDKKGIDGASLEELQAKRQQLIDFGDPRSRVKSGKGDAKEIAKAKQLDDIEAAIASKTTPVSAAPSASSSEGGGGEGSSATQGDSGASSPTATASAEPTASPMPAASNSGDQVEMATRQNTEAQMDAQSTSTKPIVMNSTNNSAAPGKTSSTSVGSQPVRDDETSVRRVKIGSVRMV